MIPSRLLTCCRRLLLLLLLLLQAAALRLGWGEFVCSPIVLDLLWVKLTAGVELEVCSSAAGPAQVSSEQLDYLPFFSCFPDCRERERVCVR